MTTNFTLGDTRLVLAPDLATADLAAGNVVIDSTRRRPLWFDGRFLAARDLANEQNYFLERLADLGRAAGFGVIHGLTVETPTDQGNPSDGETIIIRSGQGVTPAGELVMLPDDLTIRLSDLAEEQKLDLQFGLSTAPTAPARTRTGLYVIALRTVEYTANPITSYPTSIQGNRGTTDGDIIEATAISLVPYPDPVTSIQASQRRAALAQQIFLNGSPQQISDDLLPLAMVSIQRGVIDWIDMYLVRRDTGPQYSGLRFGLTDPATQQASLLQYDSMLQEVMASRQQSGLPAGFSATDYFRMLPAAGRFPIAAISTSDFSQVFFPQQLDVRLSVIPEDELPALLQDSMSLPPIDLTLSADSYANLAVFALIPVPRTGFASLKANLPTVQLQTTLPQVLAFRQPVDLLRLYNGTAALTAPPAAVNNQWQQAIGSQTLGFFIRRRSSPVFVDFTTASPGT
ncbi:MAG TPA: hypothetical protein VHX20_09940 [Terracidiphilus sp.]|jgi:hypothetical protein|nr:hypothetical protein [Terracidiphilus sp.]